jgi:hypothetical protein
MTATTATTSELAERVSRSEEAAQGLGAPPAGRRGQAVAALLAALRAGSVGAMLAGGPREWAMPVLAGDREPAEILDVERFGPGGHGGVPGEVLATLGRPGGQLARGLGVSLTGQPCAVICGSRSAVEQLPLLAETARRGAPMLVLAVHEGRTGEPEPGTVVARAQAAGLDSVEIRGGDPEELRAALAEAATEPSTWPRLLEWSLGEPT